MRAVKGPLGLRAPAPDMLACVLLLYVQAFEHRAVAKVIVVALHLAAKSSGAVSEFKGITPAILVVADVVSAIRATFRANCAKGWFEEEIDDVQAQWRAAASRFVTVFGVERLGMPRKWYKVLTQLAATLRKKAGNLQEMSGDLWENSHRATCKHRAGRAVARRVRLARTPHYCARAPGRGESHTAVLSTCLC